MRSKTLRFLLIVCGFLCVALGVVGILIPLLPTTPFLILAAYCFSKSSPRIHQWILQLPKVGAYVQEWERDKVIRPQAKIMCMVLLALTMGLSIWLGNIPTWGIIGMTTVFVAVACFVLSRPSKSKAESKTA